MYCIGSVIKSEREKKKIPQEELCFGICAVSTLSRIENGEQTPTMEKALALLNRLGLEGSSYLSFVTEEEYRFYHIRKEAEKMMSNRLYNEAYEYALKNENAMGKNVFRKQFMLFVTAAKVCYVDKEYETAIRMTAEAVRYTCPLFDENKKIRFLLTDVEVNVINLMAVSYWQNGDKVIATKLLINLTEELMELYSQSGERQNIYPMLLCNLSKWLCVQYRFEEADHYAELGRAACIQTGKFRMIPYFCCIRASVMQSSGSDTQCIMAEYINAYVMFKNMELINDATSLRSYVLEMYNRDLEKIAVLPD